jgi:uncharacterized membrane protein
MENLRTKQSFRVSSIDVLRGIIMLIMALDHVRDYFHAQAMIDQPTNLLTTTPQLFFTRWITHYCAPLFLFLSGISAFMSGQRKTKKELSVFLIKRGLWLIIFEIFIMTFILSFNPAYSLILLIVIWAIGWSMIILGLLIRTSYLVIAIVGIILVLGHNITDDFPPIKNAAIEVFLRIFVSGSGTAYPFAGRTILFAYAILPWTGIMLIGFSFGQLYKINFDAIRRKKILLWSGIGTVVFFIILRFINHYGDPAPWAPQHNAMFSFMSFVNTTKYPVSLQFTCMTLGPGLIALSLLDNIKDGWFNVVKVYGKVPLFFFAGHFLLAHILCVIAFFATGHTTDQIVDPNSPFLFRPAIFGFSLKSTYLIWLLVLMLMYYPCKWYGKYKETHKKWWLSYL